MAPHVVVRPLALVRCPEGTKGQCFFQKHASAGLTEQNLHTVIDSNKRQIIAVEDLDGLLSLVQAGVLEVHVRGSPRSICKASSSCPAARACTWCCRSRRRTGTRPRPSCRPSRRRWRRTIPTA